MASSTMYTIPAGDAVEGALVLVYHQFRDQYGNRSRVGAEPIRYLTMTDSDGDLIPDATDPDDDNDGVKDADELSVHRTNPHARDTDGDGYSDYAEIKYMSDPLSRGSLPWALHDRDGDGFSNPVEDAYGSDPDDSDDVPDLGLRIAREGHDLKAVLPTIPGLHYEFEESPDFSSWFAPDGRRVQIRGTGADYELPLDRAKGRAFYRGKLGD